jgi:hypothetical protein
MRSSKRDSRSDDRLIGTSQVAWERWQTITRTLQGRDPVLPPTNTSARRRYDNGDLISLT